MKRSLNFLAAEHRQRPESERLVLIRRKPGVFILQHDKIRVRRQSLRNPTVKNEDRRSRRSFKSTRGWKMEGFSFFFFFFCSIKYICPFSQESSLFIFIFTSSFSLFRIRGESVSRYLVLVQAVIAELQPMGLRWRFVNSVMNRTPRHDRPKHLRRCGVRELWKKHEDRRQRREL